MLRSQEVMSLQEAANLHSAVSDVADIGEVHPKKFIADEDEYLDDELAEDAVLSGATVAAFAIDDEYDDDPIGEELTLMGFRSGGDFA